MTCFVIKRSFATVDDFAVDICGIGISAEDDITDPERAYRMSVLGR